MGIQLAEVQEMVRHNFSDKEKVEFGEIVAEKVTDRIRTDNERKAIAKDYGAAIERLDVEIKDITGKIRDGYEMRREPCYCCFDYKNRKVIYFLIDDFKDEVVKDLIQQKTGNDDGFSGLVDLFSDNHDNLDFESMSVFLKENAGIKSVKSRGMRTDEFHKQRELFEVEAESTEDKEKTLDEMTAAKSKDPETAVIRDDKALKELLKEIMQRSPSIKTIKAYSDEQFEEARRWAAAVKEQSNTSEEIEIPAFPEFLPRTKKTEKS